MTLGRVANPEVARRRCSPPNLIGKTVEKRSNPTKNPTSRRWESSAPRSTIAARADPLPMQDARQGHRRVDPDPISKEVSE